MSEHVLLNLLNPLEKRIRCLYLYHKKKKICKKKNFYQINCRSVNTRHQFN